MNSYGMNQKRSLFVIGGIIAFLGVLIVVLIVTKTPEEVLSTSSEIPETVDLTNHKIGELESLTVENGEGSYTIRPTEPGVDVYKRQIMRRPELLPPKWIARRYM